MKFKRRRVCALAERKTPSGGRRRCFVAADAESHAVKSFAPQQSGALGVRPPRCHVARSLAPPLGGPALFHLFLQRGSPAGTRAAAAGALPRRAGPGLRRCSRRPGRSPRRPVPCASVPSCLATRPCGSPGGVGASPGAGGWLQSRPEGTAEVPVRRGSQGTGHRSGPASRATADGGAAGGWSSALFPSPSVGAGGQWGTVGTSRQGMWRRAV